MREKTEKGFDQCGLIKTDLYEKKISLVAFPPNPDGLKVVIIKKLKARHGG